MFSHYLNTALRHFRQHKLTTGINVACLTLGLVCFIAAWGLVSYFEERDRYHENAERTHVMTWKESASPSARVGLESAFLLAPQLQAEFPQLESVARMAGPTHFSIRHEGRSHWKTAAFVDGEFFEIFDFPVLGTDRETALQRPHTALVSRDFAVQVFGTEDVVGRVLDIGGREQVTVEGLLGNLRQPTSFSTTGAPASISFDLLVSMDTWIALLRSRVPVPGERPMGQWSPDSTTFMVLPEDRSLTLVQLNARLADFVRRIVPPGARGLPVLEARPIADMMQLETELVVGSLSATTVLRLLGILILAIACINYANLATAVAGQRMRDVALSKVVGATQRSVMGQHLFEAACLTAVAVLVALAGVVIVSWIAALATPWELFAVYAGAGEFWLVIAAAATVGSLAAGAYPAFVMARVRPIRLLRASQGRQAGSWVANSLLTVQFAFASLMIIAVLTMLTQYRELRRTLWQPDSDPIVMIFNGSTRTTVDRSLLRNELLRVPGVLGVTGSVQALWDPGSYPIDLARSSDATASRIVGAINVVDYDFLQTVGIPLLAGRDFERSRADDISDLRPTAPPMPDRNVIIDRRLAERLGFASATAAVGKVVVRTAQQTSSVASRPSPTRYHIVGVVENSLVNPMPASNRGNLFLLDPYTAATPLVRISRYDVAATLAGMDAAWKKVMPQEPLARMFADEHFEVSFLQFRVIERALMGLSIFALMICTMGLIGMALHLIRRRTHEIGVRKTLGASVSQILALLLRAFSKPVAIANVIVWPPMFFAAGAYVSLFANNTGVPLLPFILSLAISLLVTWLAVSVQATRAARVKPAEVLRYE